MSVAFTTEHLCEHLGKGVVPYYVGLPDALVTSGVVYFEVDIVQALSFPQLGFVTRGFEVGVDGYSGKGVGDCSES